jgi:hypothetical protein
MSLAATSSIALPQTAGRRLRPHHKYQRALTSGERCIRAPPLLDVSVTTDESLRMGKHGRNSEVDQDARTSRLRRIIIVDTTARLTTAAVCSPFDCGRLRSATRPVVLKRLHILLRTEGGSGSTSMRNARALSIRTLREKSVEGECVVLLASLRPLLIPSLCSDSAKRNV